MSSCRRWGLVVEDVGIAVDIIGFIGDVVVIGFIAVISVVVVVVVIGVIVLIGIIVVVGLLVLVGGGGDVLDPARTVRRRR